ncbi:TetR family transcriptional regulator C-terminal domain-containing protein [Streptomyces sp. NPDC002133]|uniref:TetR family transcriptional regulator C-terminal domain-containing protein n=1 Tax=Streptomyces sp. NPDC002133 TaxID=3154409 RepID=UPI00331A5F13
MAVLGDTNVPPLLRLRRHFEALRDENVTHGFSRGCLLGDLATEIADHGKVVRKALQDGLQQWCAPAAGSVHRGDRA